MILNTIMLIGVAQGLFMSILLLFKKEKKPPEKVLGIWMLVIVFHLLFSYLLQNHTIENSIVSVLNGSVPFIQAPMIYLYFTVLFIGKGSFKRLSLHFIPAVIALIYPFIGTKINWISNSLSLYVILSVPIYTIWILRAWIIITKKGGVSSYHQESNWLKWPLIGLVIIWLSFLILRFLPEIKIHNLHMYFFVAVTGFVYLIAIHLYRTGSSVENEHPSLNVKTISSLETALKYSKSGLTQSSAEEIKTRLIELMLNEKPYLDSELSLQNIAVSLDVRTNHLSQVINSIEGKSFNDFVNSYRIKDFIDLHQSSTKTNSTMLSEALECGFNSKASFNRIFRKEMGMSPSEYFNTR